MKKLLLSILLTFVFTINYAQNQFAYGFDGNTAAMVSAGWTRVNQSTLPSTTSLWTVASYAPVVVNSTGTPPVRNLPFSNIEYADGETCPSPNGQSGGANSFALVNYTSTTSTAATGATISNWLISSLVNVQNGDVVSFYSRTGKIAGSAGTTYPDRLQLRMSTDGAFTVDPTGGPTDVGTYNVLLKEVNPNLTTTGYPQTWTLYSATISGLSGPTDVKFGFRYFVINGGTNGANSDIIGIDSFSVDRALANTQDFFSSNFSIYPNPAKSIINLNSKNGVTINSVEITDLNGRIVKQVSPSNVSETQINVSDLNAGVYFVKAQTENGVGTTKIVKQ